MAAEMAAFLDMIGERFTCDEIRIAMMEVKADLRKAQRELRQEDQHPRPAHGTQQAEQGVREVS